MSIFGFESDQVISNSATNAGIRAKRINDNLKETFEGFKLEKELSEQNALFEENMAFEENAKGVANRSSINRRHLRQENLKLEKELTKKAVINYLTEMTMSGLVFDKDFIEDKGDGIRKEMKRIYSECYDNGSLDSSSFINSKNQLMQEAYYEISEGVKSLLNNRDNINIFNEDNIMMMLSEAEKAKDSAKEVADEVKDKVEDTLEKEKKIAKKNKEESDDDETKKEDPEVEDAADSLDNDVDDETGKDDSDDESTDDDSSEGDDTDGEDTTDENDDDDVSDEDLNDDDTANDGQDGSDIVGDDDSSEGDDEGSDDGSLDDSDGSDEEESSEEDVDSDMDAGEDTDASASTSPSSGNMVIKIETNGSTVSVHANKSESMNYLNLFGKRRYNERNSKSLFRNLIESNLRESTSMLSESAGNNPAVNMDLILAESLIQYTMLETLNTSRLLEFRQSDINRINKIVNFKRK